MKNKWIKLTESHNILLKTHELLKAIRKPGWIPVVIISILPGRPGHESTDQVSVRKACPGQSSWFFIRFYHCLSCFIIQNVISWCNMMQLSTVFATLKSPCHRSTARNYATLLMDWSSLWCSWFILWVQAASYSLKFPDLWASWIQQGPVHQSRSCYPEQPEHHIHLEPEQIMSWDSWVLWSNTLLGLRWIDIHWYPSFSLTFCVRAAQQFVASLKEFCASC